MRLRNALSVLIISATVPVAAMAPSAGAAASEEVVQQLDRAVATQQAAPPTQSAAPTSAPATGDAPVALEGGKARLGLPATGPAATHGGTSVFDAKGTPDAKVAVQGTAEGTRTLVRIGSAAAPDRYAFPLSGDGLKLALAPDGSARVLDGAGDLAGAFTRPWAVDADGKSVATRYVLEDGALVQVVDHNAPGVRHPVVADPFWVPAAVLIGRCVTNKFCRKLMDSKGAAAAARWAAENLF